MINKKYGLTRRECDVMFFLMCNKRSTVESIAEFIWSYGYQRPYFYSNVIHAHIQRIRRKIKPFGWNIENHRTYGYTLEKITYHNIGAR